MEVGIWDNANRETILDNVRRDAIRKMNSAKGEDRQPLIEAVKRVMELGDITRKHGIVTLEGVILEGEMEYMKNFLFLLPGSKDNLDYILEIAANEYWMRNLQGIQAMVFYIYLRGIIFVFFGTYPWAIKEGCISLMPEDCRKMLEEESSKDDGYSIQFTPKVKEKIESYRKLWEKEAEKEELEKKKLSRKFYAFSPVFHNPKLLEKLHELEIEFTENLSDQSIADILWASDHGKRNLINRCLYGLSNEARMKILDCGYGEDGLFEMPKFLRMQYVLELGEQGEEEILGSVLMMLGTIKRMRRMGKI